ncbi:type II/IV secretion system protein [Candidatus Dependentiae bacterium]|nr:MAG: type II/IV secretion system protein [Candidatus Dependentiae bacterium]
MEYYGIQRVEQLLALAFEKKASDIHIEPFKHNARIRMRVDGILVTIDTIEEALLDQVIARLKVLAGINVTQKRLAQDGKFIYTSNNKSVDIRLSSFPCVFGEKIVLRILDASIALITIDSIGFENAMYADIKHVLSMSGGFFIVTGPTGSGKTTTLYALLQALNNDSVNIMTLEDPVEYTLPGVTQTQINNDIGFTFDVGMRAMLRQDPDIILIGEVRDSQTAKTAIEAAMTGHLVFTTMHTVDSLSAIVRLIEMGIEPYLIEASLNGVIAQRLARKLCNACKIKAPVTEGQKAFLQKIGTLCDFVWQAKGCALCLDTGYNGRVGLFEYVAITQEIKERILRSSGIKELRTLVKNKQISLFADVACKVIQQGTTSVEECLRVVPLIDD